jgi:hypothetical protein
MKKIGITGVAVTMLFIIVSLFAAATARSEIYINYLPVDIVINEGEPVDVPIFFKGRLYVNKPVGFYIFKEDLITQAKAYLSPTGWVSFTDNSEVRNFASLDSMVEYANIVFRAFDNTWGMNSILLSVCIDPNLSGQLTEGADCSQRAVLITEAQNNTQVCSGVTVSPTSIPKTLTRGQSATVQISVKDSCGNNIAVTSFDATSEQNWISLTKQAGNLTATLNSSSLLPTTHNGVIKVSSGGVTAQVSVSLTVKAPTITIK